MSKAVEHQGPQSPPKENLDEHIIDKIEHLSEAQKDARRLVDFFALLLILVFLMVVAF